MLKTIIYFCIIIKYLISTSSCNENHIIHNEGDTNNDLDSEPKKYDELDKIDELDKEKYENIYENDINQENVVIDPHSFFYDRLSKTVIVDTEVSPITITSTASTSKSSNEGSGLKECNEDFEMLKVYYKRLVMMLLFNSNLKIDGDMVEGHLIIKGTKMQIETLKKIETENYSLKDIDLILSKIISEPSLVNIFFNQINLGWIVQSVFEFANSYKQTISIVSTALGAVILCRVMPWRRLIFLSIVIGLAVSIFMTYLQLVKEAEIKMAAIQAQYTDIPTACKPANMTLLDRIKLIFINNNECEKYYEARISDTSLEVTPALVLTHFLSTIILHPFSVFGDAISKFVNNSTARLPLFMQSFITVLLFLLIPAFLVIAIISLRGGSVRLGFLHLFDCSVSVSETNPLSTSDGKKREAIQLIREVFAELPEIIPQQITTNNDLPKALPIKENDNPTDDVSKEPSKLMLNKSVKELNPAGGDADQNNFFSEENEEKTEKLVEDSEINTEIGGGDN